MKTRSPRMLLASAIVAAAFSLAAGCTKSARRDELVSRPVRLENARLAEGREVFTANCNVCHPGGAAGLGPALNNRKFLLNPLIKFQVRHGVGAMPKFSKRKISDEQLDALVAYLDALRVQRPAVASR